jgi:hypothetical protein
MKTIRRCSALIILIVAPFFCCSCPIPVYYSKDSGSARIDSSGVRPGVTTKEDVFIRFGNTFKSVGDSEKLFMATLAESDVFYLLLFVGAGYTGTAFPVYGKNFDAVYEVEIEFDDNDVIKRCETFKLPRDKSQEKKPTENK